MSKDEALRKVNTLVSSTLEDLFEESISIMEDHGFNSDDDYEMHVGLCEIIQEVRQVLNEMEEEVLSLRRGFTNE